MHDLVDTVRSVSVAWAAVTPHKGCRMSADATEFRVGTEPAATAA